MTKKATARDYVHMANEAEEAGRYDLVDQYEQAAADLLGQQVAQQVVEPRASRVRGSLPRRTD